MNAYGYQRPTLSCKERISPAEMAAQLVTSHASDDEIIKAARALINGKTDSFRRQISLLAARSRPNFMMNQAPPRPCLLPRDLLATSPCLHIATEPFDASKAFAAAGSHAGFAASLLSPQRPASERGPIVTAMEEALDLNHELHGDELDWLKAQAPEIYAAIKNGRLDASLNLAALAEPEHRARVIKLIGDHALFLSVRTAHKHAGIIRTLERAPLGSKIKYPTTWLTVGSVMNATLIEPAALIGKLLTSRLPTDDEQAIAMATEKKLLSDCPNGRRILTLAQQIRREGVTPDSLNDTIVNIIAEKTKPIAAIKSKDLMEASLSRKSFCEEYFDVTAPEAAVFLAREICLCRQRIEATIAHLFPVPPSRRQKATELSNNKIARITEALRVVSKADRRAPSEIGPKENRNSKQLVMKTLKKLDEMSKIGIECRATTVLRIDPDVWLTRKHN